ncbi:hypothetical protein GCM10011499_18450 [Pelagibacterium lentulum]|uniref:Metallo-beta-lactamase domain-containing protein n=1 Tax=Pelagibacterium lentulum TaxID=2029865 RepID=A0A916VXH0_9HYPH|nr:hypothetical protein GCM10011499_18450 [Pelagibacterium lentulum]
MRLAGEDGPFWILIDFGVHSSVKGGTEVLRAIAKDILAQTKKIDLLVVTHEHWDHVSGFLYAAEALEGLDVDEVWMPWTEDPQNPLARRLDSYKGQAFAALRSVMGKLERSGSPALRTKGEQLESLLGFELGAKGDRVRTARNKARDLAKSVTYLAPSDAPLHLESVPGLRIFVLGPPLDAALFNIETRTSEMYGPGMGGGWALAGTLAAAPGLGIHRSSGGDWGAPFDSQQGADLNTVLSQAAQPAEEGEPEVIDFVRNHYASEGDVELDDGWRRIDADWLGVAEDLALQLDRGVNNTSLVLAFEFTDSGRVVLFPGDAQVGNWLSWHNLSWTIAETTTTAGDLLSRTVYFKVAHHGSENATLEEKGLELMTHPDLSAFIPTNKEQALKVGWKHMPYGPILGALERRASGRVIRADDNWLTTGKEPAFAAPSGSIRKLNHDPGGLWIELEIG